MKDVLSIQARMPQELDGEIQSAASKARVSKEKMTRYLLYTGLRQFNEDLFGDNPVDKNSALMYVGKIDEILAMETCDGEDPNGLEKNQIEEERTIKAMNE